MFLLFAVYEASLTITSSGTITFSLCPELCNAVLCCATLFSFQFEDII